MQLFVRRWGSGDKLALLVHGLFQDLADVARTGRAGGLGMAELAALDVRRGHAPGAGMTWDEEVPLLPWDAPRRTGAAVVPGLAAGTGYDYSAEWAGAPSMVIAADPREFISPEHAGSLRNRGLQVETARGSTHSWFREDYPAFLGRLDEWLRLAS